MTTPNQERCCECEDYKELRPGSVHKIAADNCHFNHMDTQNHSTMEGSPLWAYDPKYRSIWQIVLAANEWNAKYPLLEAVIDQLLAKERESAERRGRLEVVEFIREIASSYESPIGKVYRVADSTLNAAVMEVISDDEFDEAARKDTDDQTPH